MILEPVEIAHGNTKCLFTHQNDPDLKEVKNQSELRNYLMEKWKLCYEFSRNIG